MKRIAVVVSQGQSANPAKRQLEEDIVGGLLMEPGIDVVVIPHLYDLSPDGTGMLALNGIMGNMIVLSWLYERGARWTLDRFGIRGKEGLTLIKSDDDDEEDEDAEESSANGDDKQRVIDTRDLPNRRIYCLDKVETILVEQPDNCRKGCPACSRVCPENAIIFPQHKTPTIAGADVVAGSLKIDLSLLFGAPESGETAEQAAVRERDEQL